MVKELLLNSSMQTSTLKQSSAHEHDWEESFIPEIKTPVFKKCRNCPQRLVINYAGYKRWRMKTCGADAVAFATVQYKR